MFCDNESGMVIESHQFKVGLHPDEFGFKLDVRDDESKFVTPLSSDSSLSVLLEVSVFLYLRLIAIVRLINRFYFSFFVGRFEWSPRLFH